MLGINELPARKIYEEVLPNIISKEIGDHIPYHRGSPYGGKGWDTTDPTIGDVHQWNVWGGKEYQYQEYDRLGGRFVRCDIVLCSQLGCTESYERLSASLVCRECPVWTPSGTGRRVQTPRKCTRSLPLLLNTRKRAFLSAGLLSS